MLETLTCPTHRHMLISVEEMALNELEVGCNPITAPLVQKIYPTTLSRYTTWVRVRRQRHGTGATQTRSGVTMETPRTDRQWGKEMLMKTAAV